MDPCEDLRLAIIRRKEAQNLRAAKAGKKPKHKLPNATKAPSKAQKPPPADSGKEEDTALSFEEWSAAGWSVMKGQKYDHLSIEGVPQFLRSQVRKINPSWSKWRSSKSDQPSRRVGLFHSPANDPAQTRRAED